MQNSYAYRLFFTILLWNNAQTLSESLFILELLLQLLCYWEG